MPLSKGCSAKSISSNISSLMSGHGHVRPRSQKQSVRIALETARKAGCSVPGKNPPKNVLKWFKDIYNAGESAAINIIEEFKYMGTNLYSVGKINKIYYQSLLDLEDANEIVFDKIEKELFLEGFLHGLIKQFS
jgi:hypothetical protein